MPENFDERAFALHPVERGGLWFVDRAAALAIVADAQAEIERLREEARLAEQHQNWLQPLLHRAEGAEAEVERLRDKSEEHRRAWKLCRDEYAALEAETERLRELNHKLHEDNLRLYETVKRYREQERDA